MFKYTGIIHVSAHEFFDILLQQICADINNKTGKNYDNKSIMNGCRYKVKKSRGTKTSEAIIEVRKPVLDRKVETHYSEAGRNYAMIYEIVEKGPQEIEVTYTQEDGREKSGKLASIYVSRTTKKRFKEFEKYIISSRQTK